METALLSTIAVLLIFAFSSGAKAANHYDYLQFVQQWPITLCYKNSDCIPGARLPLGFFIHGLWPSNFSGPNQPCVGTPFNSNVMLNQHSLMGKLEVSWRSFTRRPNMSFWEHEYNRHGTCSENNLPQTRYFSKAHRLWESYKAHRMFRKSRVMGHRIVPGYPYRYRDLRKAVRQEIGGKNPSLICKHEPANNTWMLHEVIICFNATRYNVIDCVRRSSCSGAANGYIHYPSR
ncbi:hypothetical protein ABKV19_021887 [Rosa sericea]